MLVTSTMALAVNGVMQFQHTPLQPHLQLSLVSLLWHLMTVSAMSRKDWVAVMAFTTPIAK